MFITKFHGDIVLPYFLEQILRDTDCTFASKYLAWLLSSTFKQTLFQWRTVGQRIGGGGAAPSSGVICQNIWGAQSLRGSVATEWGEGVGGVGSFFIFRLENVQSGAYLRRKFRLDDMYYMGKRVTIRPTGKRVFFS